MLCGLSPYRFFSPSPSHKIGSSAPNLGSEHRSRAPRRAAMSITSSHPLPPDPVADKNRPMGAAQPAAAPTKPVLKVARQNLTSAGPPEAAAQQRAKTLPEARPALTPETRPTTIPSWTVREVVGGSVVLDG